MDRAYPIDLPPCNDKKIEKLKKTEKMEAIKKVTRQKKRGFSHEISANRYSFKYKAREIRTF